MQFADIIDQEEVKSFLRKSFFDGRISHATMFLGPQGNGNLALAVAFAQFIACTDRKPEDSCGNCPTCKKFASFQFADLYFSFPFFNITGEEKTVSDDWFREWRSLMTEGLYFDLDSWRNKLTAENKQLHISVYEAQNIVRKLSLKSYEGGYKFMIIWMPEFMRQDTANKLLKIVEEPPDNTLFFFVSSSTEMILPTMLSRIQVIRVPALKDEKIEEGLVKRGIEQPRARDIAHFAKGDWFRALQLAEQNDPNAFYSSQFQTWMRLCYSRDLIGISKWAEIMHALPREEQKHFLRYSLEQLRQNLMLNYAGDALARLNQEEKDFSSKFSRFINHLNIEDLVKEIHTAHDDISRNSFSKMVFLDLSLKTHRLLRRQEA